MYISLMRDFPDGLHVLPHSTKHNSHQRLPVESLNGKSLLELPISNYQQATVTIAQGTKAKTPEDTTASNKVRVKAMASLGSPRLLHSQNVTPT